MMPSWEEDRDVNFRKKGIRCLSPLVGIHESLRGAGASTSWKSDQEKNCNTVPHPPSTSHPTDIPHFSAAAAAAAKSLQSCPTLCDPIDSSPPGSPGPGILQARTLEWVAISFSNAWKWKVKLKSLSRVQLLATPWTAAYQAPLSMGFSRQEHWSGLWTN